MESLRPPSAPRRTTPWGRLLLALAAAAAVGCQSLRRPLVIDSEPPGATVRINGEDSGFATPCVLDLRGITVETVDLELAGYRTERRELRDGSWSRVKLWNEMSIGTQTWRFPLFLPTRHLLLPIEGSDGETPPRIHVRLVRERSQGGPGAAEGAPDRVR